MRINKYIASSGICSRRKAEEYINQGKIYLNGSKVTDLATQVGQDDVVTLDGKKISIEEEKVYLVLNKPKGYITTSNEQFERNCIMDLINENVRVFPVGRLDMDTEGIIILTNDGEFANELMHPRNKLFKTYIAKLNYDVSDSEIETLRNGIDIGGYITKKAVVKKIKKNVVSISIAEGKNRQIRRMFEAINKRVVKLKRIAIGNFEPKDIALGEYKKFSLEDLKRKIYAK